MEQLLSGDYKLLRKVTSIQAVAFLATSFQQLASSPGYPAAAEFQTMALAVMPAVEAAVMGNGLALECSWT